MRLRTGVGLWLLCAGAASPAGAAVIAEDSFSYPAGQTVNGQSGGSGWSGAWITGQPAAFSGAAAIAGAPAIGQSGGAMAISGSGRIFRVIDTGAGSAAAQAGLVQSHTAMFFGTINGIGAPGTTVWVGVLVSGGSGAAGVETQYHLYDGARTDATSLMLGDSNKDGEAVAMLRGGNVPNWGFERTCGHATCATSSDAFWATNPAVLFGGTHWSVTRLVFQATTTAITMWVDPPAGPTPPADAAALALTPFSGGAAAKTTIVPALFFNTIAPNAAGNFNYVVDEIRIGTSFADLSGGVVAPVDGGLADASLGPDAGALDAAVGVDGSVATDGGTTGDGGGSSDGASSRDATSAGDAGSAADAAGPQGSASGCGCSTGGSRTPGAPLLLLFAVPALVARRRRRGI